MAKHAPRGPRLANPMNADHPKERVTCKATNRQGKRCGKAPILGGTVCRLHGGAAPQVQASARARLLALQPEAISALEHLLKATDFPTVMLGAARDVLDRTEGKAVETQTVTHAGGITIRHVMDDDD